MKTKALKASEVKKIHVSGAKGKFARFRVADSKRFAKKSFRTIGVGKRGTKIVVGCPKGKFTGSKCKVGMKKQSVLVPKQRFTAVQKIRAYKAVANPLLMAVGANPKKNLKRKKRNPLLMAVSNPAVARCPFPQDKKIPIDVFKNWLYANGNPTEIKRFKQAMQSYKKFHLGAEPESVSRQVLKIGSNDITDRDFVYSAGKSPADLYEVPAHSGKENNKRGYIHHWKDRPETLVTRDGKAIFKPLKGKARVTDWMRG